MRIIKILMNGTAILTDTKHVLTMCIFILSQTALALEELGDQQPSEVTGQAILQMGKTEGSGFTFYKAGLDAELELNIAKLQLGRGGENGPGCDIDIDHLSLSGDCANRPECSSLMVRPFFEFAIKNDDFLACFVAWTGRTFSIRPFSFPQLQSAINNLLALNPAKTNDLAGIISGNGLSVNTGNLNLSAYPLSLGLSNLQLAGQNFSPNCYGSAKFC